MPKNGNFLPQPDSLLFEMSKGYFGDKGKVGKVEMQDIEVADVETLALMKQVHVKDLLMHPQVQQDPDLLAQVWTGALLNVRLRKLGIVNGEEEQVLAPPINFMGRRHHDKSWMRLYHNRVVRQNLGDSGYFEKVILPRVQSGNAETHELLLAMWQASAHERLLCINPLPFGIEDSTDSKTTVGDVVSRGKLPAQEALFMYWQNMEFDKWLKEQIKKEAAGENFKTKFATTDVSLTSPRLPMKVLAYAIKSSGLLENLNLEEPDYFLYALTSDYIKYCSTALSTNSGTTRDGGNIAIDPTMTGELRLRDGLESYVQDLESTNKANSHSRHGSPWRFLQRDGPRRYNHYLNGREKFIEKANDEFYASIDSSAQNLKFKLNNFLVQLNQDDLSEDLTTETREKLGSVWAAVSLRQDEKEVRHLTAEYSSYVKTSLETHMLDGAGLLESKKRNAPIWMYQAALDAISKKEQLHLFTPNYGSVKQDTQIVFDAAVARYSFDVISAESGERKTVKHYTREHNEIMLAVDIYKSARNNDPSLHDPATGAAFRQLQSIVNSVNNRNLESTLRNLRSGPRKLVKWIVDNQAKQKRAIQNAAYEVD